MLQDDYSDVNWNDNDESNVVVNQEVKEESVVEKTVEKTEDNSVPVKRLIDLAGINVVLAFKDKSGFVVPLTDLQGAFLIRMLGFKIDSETNELTHYTDDEMRKIYDFYPKKD